MTNRKGRAFGIGAVVLFVLAALFNENLASLYEETGLNKGWTFVGPVFRTLGKAIRFLGHPIMTHIYTFIGGVAVGLGVVAWAVKQNRRTPQADKLISLTDVVDYLTTETTWAESRTITDKVIEFELIDVLSQNRLEAFARPLDSYGQASPLRRVGSDYFEAVTFDVRAIQTGRSEQVHLKAGYEGDRFHHWQFRRSQVESVWPRSAKPKRAKTAS